MLRMFELLEDLLLRWSDYGNTTQCWLLDSILSNTLLLYLKLALQCLRFVTGGVYIRTVIHQDVSYSFTVLYI